MPAPPFGKHDMRIAIDTGGTFTDCVYAASGELHVLKVPSTPADPGEAVLNAVSQVSPEGTLEVRHGTTVGTNALLERKGARVAFLTTAGFEDTLAIGRQARPKLYDWFWTKDPPLAPRELCFGVEERTASDGTVLLAVSPEEQARLKQTVAGARPEAIAISLLFGFANPHNEQAVAAALAELGCPISLSHEILSEFRENERASTVLINAYLAPRMQHYLNRLYLALTARNASFHVMQSSGGILPASMAAREPVRTILSGPAGGVVGAMEIARASGYPKILSFDMGGTSTDVALIDTARGLETTRESQIIGLPVAVPTLSIHTVGAGGGSLASFQSTGALKVGPESAGADPGPICYGRGLLPTVTDANLLLGRLEPAGLLGGSMPLDIARARSRFLELKGPLPSVEAFAEGIIQVVDSHMEAALRRISVEQGHDPRDFALVSFGGAGPLHACALAQALRIPVVLVPNAPGALSAYGILVSDYVRDYSRTVMLQPDDPSLRQHLENLEQSGHAELTSLGLTGQSTRSLDMRYAGQGYELTLPWSARALAEFHQMHERRFGYADRKRPVEVVTARVRLTASSTPPLPWAEPSRTGLPESALLGTKPLFAGGRWHAAQVYHRSLLRPGSQFPGAALVVEYSATTYLPPGAQARLDEQRNLLIEMPA